MSNVSLSQFLSNAPQTVANLPELILSIAQICQDIDKTIQKGALTGILGSAEHQNVQGETQKKLDIISNDMLIDFLSKNPHVAGLASEELDDFVAGQKNGDFLIAFDPLDGSSNIDINMCVGTIFSILKAPQGDIKAEDFFQKGTEQLASGYVLYGPSTMLVFTTGHGVHMFTLDSDSGEYYLTKENVQIPEDTQEFAINSSNARHWEEPVKRYIAELQEGKAGMREKDFNMRWVACMVGDVHRILTRGGIFLYPYDFKDPNRAGRLRLLYEGNPLGLLIEQAGGKASTGRLDILSIQPDHLHQRVPVILGSKNEVERVANYHNLSSANHRQFLVEGF